MINAVNNKPVIGFLSGLGSGIAYVIKTALTDDTVLKFAAGIAVWIGLFVAVLTFYTRWLEIKRLRSKQ